MIIRALYQTLNNYKQNFFNTLNIEQKLFSLCYNEILLCIKQLNLLVLNNFNNNNNKQCQNGNDLTITCLSIDTIKNVYSYLVANKYIKKVYFLI